MANRHQHDVPNTEDDAAQMQNWSVASTHQQCYSGEQPLANPFSRMILNFRHESVVEDNHYERCLRQLSTQPAAAQLVAPQQL